MRKDGKKYLCKVFTRTISSFQILQKSQGYYRAIEWAGILKCHLETQRGKDYRKDFISCLAFLCSRQRVTVERSQGKVFGVDNR